MADETNPGTKDCRVTQRELDEYKKTSREYIDLNIKVINKDLEGKEKALKVADEEAKKQYNHLNNLRDTMVLEKVYVSDIKALRESLQKAEKMLYIGLGIVLTIEAIIVILFKMWKG